MCVCEGSLCETDVEGCFLGGCDVSEHQVDSA